MELLEVLKEKNRNFSIAELAEAMDLPPSTVHRILQTFCEKKYVIRDDRSHTYRLGPALIPLGKAAARGIRLQDAAHSILTQLAKQTKEDAYLVIPVGNKGLVIEKVDGPRHLKVVEEFGYEMAKQGALVVSGMARGIDAAAQRGALRAGGLTAAVLGGGVDVVYPAENRRLYEDIAAVGVLLSEYPPGTEPRSGHFPVRNRIMSGLTLASVVVEAPPRSGALITAHLALDQGRDVFAVPGPITAEASRGCNELIREGAGLASCAWDILGEYEARFPLRLHKTGAKLPPMPEGSEPPQPDPPAQKPQAEREEKPTLPVLDLSGDHGLTDEQLLVLRTLSTTEPMLTDDLALRTDLPMRRVLSALTILEIDGLTCEAGARCFLRAVELKE